MQLSRTSFSIAFVSLSLGLMLALQIQSFRQSPNYIAPYRWSSLTKQLDDLRQKNNVLTEEVIALRAKLSRPGFGTNTQALENNLAQYSTAAGLTTVSGPGIILVLNDGIAPVSNPSDALVHDFTLLKVVNELNVAGATAISINGERWVSSTEIRCAGPTIVMNMQRIAAPFEIRVIGDPKTLEAALYGSGGYLNILKQWGIRVIFRKQDSMEVQAFKGIIPAQYAHSTE